MRWFFYGLFIFLVLEALAIAHAEIPLVRFGYIVGVTHTQRTLMQ
jgi:hypothetical protein